MSTAAPEPEDDAEAAGEDLAFRPEDWSALSSRISEVKEAEEESAALKQKLSRISHAFVLVFDVDTEDEAVYIMDVEDEQGVVLAFETKSDAEEYARSLEALDMDAARQLQDSVETSVQALDLEVLVVSSREADFRVAMVFDGDLSIRTSGGERRSDQRGRPAFGARPRLRNRLEAGPTAQALFTQPRPGPPAYLDLLSSSSSHPKATG